MYCDLWPYVWLINESGFKSRAAYDGARTVCIFFFEKVWSETGWSFFRVSFGGSFYSVDDTLRVGW